jgi:hypothetical protein
MEIYLKKLVPIYAAILIIFSVYSIYVGAGGFATINQRDFLNFNLGECNGHQIYGWGISHVVMYFIIGAIYPEYWKEAFMIGIMWEAVETLLGPICVNKVETSGIPSNVAYDLWWSGSITDLFLNGFGLICGIWMSRSLKWGKRRKQSKKAKKSKEVEKAT